MRLKFVLAVLAAACSAPVFAQTAAVEAPAASRLSLDTPIEQLVADAAGKAVLDANFPGMTAHPAFDQFKAMSLKQVQPFSQGAISEEGMAKAAVALAAIK